MSVTRAQKRAIYLLTSAATALSIGHHVDHLIRGNAVGWPLAADINAFTASLGIYPIIAVALLLTWAGRLGPGSWVFISGGGAAFVGAVHFGPIAVEPPQMILGVYESPIAGWLAFGELIAFVSLLIITAIYEIRAWYGGPRGTSSATGVEVSR